MKNILKINCYKTYNSSIDYKEEARKLEKAMIKSKKILEDMHEYWKGQDYDEFYNNFGTYLNDMELELKRLKNCAKIMETAALLHGKVDSDFIDQMKRRIKDEQ